MFCKCISKIKEIVNKKSLTACMKKSSCNTLTMPKLVNLKTLSMIHMRLGSIPGLGFQAAINMGTSAVLWWLARTKVRLPLHAAGSSPVSITAKKGSILLLTRNLSGEILIKTELLKTLHFHCFISSVVVLFIIIDVLTEIRSTSKTFAQIRKFN